MISYQSLGLLCTGCSVALISQYMTFKGVALAQAQAMVWTKYNLNFILSWLVELSGLSTRKSFTDRRSLSTENLQEGLSSNITSHQNLALIFMGILDVIGYSLNCLGFIKCGAALSMVVGAASGQICTAITRLLILKKPLTLQQYVAVATVSIGLIIRSLDGIVWQDPLNWRKVDLDIAAGVLLIVLGALAYSVLGVTYEWLMQLPESKDVCQAQINQRMSRVGALAISGYQAIFTWPRRHDLIIKQIQDSKVSVAHVLFLYLLFGSIFTVHSHVQGYVLGRHGAVSVGIINSLRAVVVSVSSAAIFCRPGSTSQCLTLTSASSAIVVTLGAVLWATAPRPKVQDKNR